MFIADGAGVISSVIYGPDQRTRIQPTTRAALYTVYAPPGIGAAAVQSHLEDLRALVQAAYPGAKAAQLGIYG
jgi:DNA/RNA-binding domain of Phe-tRNA-synthetase-like protein